MTEFEAADHRDQQHEETMRVLEAQTAAQQGRHEETMRALEAQTEVLRVLIERTAPPLSTQ